MRYTSFSSVLNITTRGKIFIRTTTDFCPNFSNLNNDQKLIWLFSRENINVLKAVSDFISKHVKNWVGPHLMCIHNLGVFTSLTHLTLFFCIFCLFTLGTKRNAVLNLISTHILEHRSLGALCIQTIFDATFEILDTKILLNIFQTAYLVCLHWARGGMQCRVVLRAYPWAVFLGARCGQITVLLRRTKACSL